jgi:hypothetical protein
MCFQCVSNVNLRSNQVLEANISHFSKGKWITMVLPDML